MKRDIFNDKSDLLIYLEDAVEKITCYDLRDTLLNGYNLRCFITASGGSGKYYVVTIPVDKQSLSFRVPFLALTTNLGAGSNYAMSEYYGGVGSRILNLNNQNLLWATLNLNNGSKYTISNDNVFVQFRWPGTNRQYYAYVPLKRGVNLTNWSINAGGSSTMNYGCDRSQIPKMTNASEDVLLVTTNIVYKHTDGYYYNITDYVILRMKKDSGPDPEYVTT